MSDRLRHLLRQQAILREHLAWIEVEIAQEQASRHNATPPAPAMPPPDAPAVGAHSTPSLATSAVAASADDETNALIERYAADERQNPEDVRRGCLLAFCAALLLMVLVVGGVWFAFYR